MYVCAYSPELKAKTSSIYTEVLLQPKTNAIAWNRNETIPPRRISESHLLDKKYVGIVTFAAKLTGA